MASQRLTERLNKHRGTSSHAEAPQPYCHDPYNNSDSQVPEHHENRGGWEGVHDEISTLPTSAGDSVFPGFYGWDDDCGISGLPSHNVYPGDKWKHSDIFVECGSLLPELGSWEQTSDAPPALRTKVTLRAGLMGTGFQSTMDSLQMPISANAGKENFHSYLHNFLDTNESGGVMEESESANLFKRNAASFEQCSSDFSLSEESSSPAPLNTGFDSRLLEYSINNKQDNFLHQPPHYQDPTPSVSNTSSYGSLFSWDQSIDYGPKLDFFDDSFTVLPSQAFEITYLPHNAILSSTQDSQASHLCLNEVLPISSTQSYPENTSLIPGNPSLLSDTLQYRTSYNPESLYHTRSEEEELMRQNENTTSLKAKVTVEDLLSEPTNWQHISSSELKPHQAIKEIKQERKSGRRHGRLKPEIAKNARVMRHLRACLPCVIMKMSCSPGDICKRCSTLSPQSPGKRICNRAHLEDFTDLLFPVLFVAHLRPQSVDQLSSELSLGLGGIDIEVALTCGSEHIPLSLVVSEFTPKSNQAARIATVSTRSTNGLPLFEYQCPPPIAFSRTYNDLFERCRNHIKLMVKQERTLPGPITERGHKINRLTLRAITRYHGFVRHSRTTATLEKAMMVHAIYIFMATTLTITGSSKKNLIGCLRKPTRIDYDSNIASRLLNRQIKSGMHALRQQLMREVLEELERELRTKSKAVWAPCFCVALILCMCIEEAQIAMDAFAMHTRVLGSEKDSPSSQATIESCRKLDDLLYNHLIELFHGVYKTHQTSKSHNNGRVYNPIRDGPEIDVKEGLDKEAADLAFEFRQIIADHEDEIVERAAKPSFGDDHDSLARHMAFRAGSSARLVSSFLRSFYYL